jgi:hypothetical protein
MAMGLLLYLFSEETRSRFGVGLAPGPKGFSALPFPLTPAISFSRPCLASLHSSTEYLRGRHVGWLVELNVWVRRPPTPGRQLNRWPHNWPPPFPAGGGGGGPTARPPG